MEHHRSGRSLDELDKTIEDFWFASDFDVSKPGEHDITIPILGWWRQKSQLNLFQIYDIAFYRELLYKSARRKSLPVALDFFNLRCASFLKLTLSDDSMKHNDALVSVRTTASIHCIVREFQSQGLNRIVKVTSPMVLMALT